MYTAHVHNSSATLKWKLYKVKLCSSFRHCTRLRQPTFSNYHIAGTKVVKMVTRQNCIKAFRNCQGTNKLTLPMHLHHKKACHYPAVDIELRAHF